MRGGNALQPPLVTIGMPIFNGGRYLKEALEAALSQTYPNLEIIISDNGSTDDTEEVCRAYATRHPSVRYIRQPVNLGMNGNFNFLVEAAKGKYFCWLAADDGMAENYVETLVDCLESHPDWVVAGTDIRIIDSAGQFVRIDEIPALRPERVAREWPSVRREFYRYYLDKRFHLLYGLYRKDALRGIDIQAFGLLREIAGTEIPFLAQVSARGKAVCLAQPLKVFRVHEDSAYASLNKSGLAWRLRNYRNIWRCLWTVAARSPADAATRLRTRAYLLASFPYYAARMTASALRSAILGTKPR